MTETILKVEKGSTVVAVFGGPLPGKANSREIGYIWHRGRRIPRIRKSDVALRWASGFSQEMKWLWYPRKPLQGDLEILAQVYQPDRRRDLEVELLKDGIQEAEIIENDNQFVHVCSRLYVDKKNPRVEFQIRPVTVLG